MAQRSVLCKKCGSVFPKRDKRCPECGRKYKKPIHMRWWFVLAYLTSFLFFAASNIRTYGLPPMMTEMLGRVLPTEVSEMLAGRLPEEQKVGMQRAAGVQPTEESEATATPEW